MTINEIKIVDLLDDDLLYEAWAVIANAGGGNWDNESEDWRKAAEKWRDKYHAQLAEGAESSDFPLKNGEMCPHCGRSYNE